MFLLDNGREGGLATGVGLTFLCKKCKDEFRPVVIVCISKGGNAMEWLERMNRAMDYIEAKLADEISLEELAKIACCSTYHFQRMFPFITGIPLSEYIRRRRLTMAAFELKTTGAKVIDVALKYGYRSPEAFARAFRQHHGVMPASARDPGVALKAWPRMTFQLSVKGDVEMNYLIEQRGPFELFGVWSEISLNLQEAFGQVARFRKQCDEDGSVDRINGLLGRFGNCALHAALFDHKGETCKYMIGYHLPKGLDVPDGMSRLSVPAQTWAVFPDPQCELPKLWQRIYTEWFPTSGYEQAEGPQFEMYYGMPGYTQGEIWIPVRKKA